MESVSKKKIVQRSDVYAKDQTLHVQRSVVYAKDQTLRKKSASSCRFDTNNASAAYGDMQRQVGASLWHGRYQI